MRPRDKAYSRLVGLLKVGLPLAALALLSTLFLLARTLDPEDALPWATVNIEELLRDQRLTAPEFAGVTAEGDELLFIAEKAFPGTAGSNGAHATAPLLRLISPEGAETRIEAATARIDTAAGALTLEGDVALNSASGYQLTSDRIESLLDRSAITSPGPVAGFGPGVQISAGAMSLSRPAPGAPEVVVFNGGVRLLYTPQAPAPALAP